ncbi:MAG: class I SAM-dependent methyltransferase, partial [Planctomycetota bacterium]
MDRRPQRDCSLEQQGCDSGGGDDSTNSLLSDLSFDNKYLTRNPVSRMLVGIFFRHLSELLAMTEGKILDVGAGQGGAYMFLSEEVLGRGIVAVEPNVAYFEKMAEVAPTVEQVEGSIYNLPFEDKSFDTVMCSEVLEHLAEPDKGIGELLRVCRGRLV